MFFKVLAAIVAADAFRSRREAQEREAWIRAWQRAVAAAPPPDGVRLPPGVAWPEAPERPC